MQAATLSSKGQVTIPKAIRDRLKLRPGDRVAFVVQGDVVALEPVSESILDWYGTLALAGRPIEDWQSLRADVMHAVATATATEGIAEVEASEGGATHG